MDSDTRLFVNRELTKAFNELSDLRRLSAATYFGERKLIENISAIKNRLAEIEDTIANEQIKLWKD